MLVKDAYLPLIRKQLERKLQTLKSIRNGFPEGTDTTKTNIKIKELEDTLLGFSS